jgi:Regulator of chromosome condensation (RCC1) repeat
MRGRVDQRYSAAIAAVGVWWLGRVGSWSPCSRESTGAGGCEGAGSGHVWMLVRGLGVGVVVVVFGLSVSAARAAVPAGGVLAFGENDFGQLGSSANNGVNSTPTLVGLPGEIGPVTEVAAGGAHRKTLDKPRCIRNVPVGTLTATGHAGPNHLPFKGRIPRAKTLGPGTYALVIAAHAFGSTSRPRTLTFTILPG